MYFRRESVVGARSLSCFLVCFALVRRLLSIATVVTCIATQATNEPITADPGRKVGRGIGTRIVGSRDILYVALCSTR